MVGHEDEVHGPPTGLDRRRNCVPAAEFAELCAAGCGAVIHVPSGSRVSFRRDLPDGGPPSPAGSYRPGTPEVVAVPVWITREVIVLEFTLALSSLGRPGCVSFFLQLKSVAPPPRPQLKTQLRELGLLRPRSRPQAPLHPRRAPAQLGPKH
ncbi:hypothetical protein Bbelb_116700 [Branchiostoma belcheri]|nr:hypothetical protein Bbelb_116700 [Branchiostoma belcheri]